MRGVLRNAMLAAALCFAPAGAVGQAGETLPADGESAHGRLDESPRHGEWVDIEEGRPGGGSWHDSVRAWIGYPEPATRAPVVIVIHEIYGLTDWIMAITDQLAAEGFIAIAPDLLTGLGPDGGGTLKDRQEAVKLVRSLRVEDATPRLTSVVRYASSLPASSERHRGAARPRRPPRRNQAGPSEPPCYFRCGQSDEDAVGCALTPEHKVICNRPCDNNKCG